jgi:beta-barrel assembly-enhancing protease
VSLCKISGPVNFLLVALATVLLPRGVDCGEADSTKQKSFGDYLEQVQVGLKTLDDLAALLTAIPASQEMDIGRGIAERLNMDLELADGDAVFRARRVVERLSKHAERQGISYSVRAIESESINAFAVAGGNIWVTTGMLQFATDDNELAGVMAHEIVHVDARHCIRRIQYELRLREARPEYADYVGIGHKLYLRSYRQLDELEADRVGARLAYQAGYDPQAMVDFLGEMAALEGGEPLASSQQVDTTRILTGIKDFLKSHPDSRIRQKKLGDYLEAELLPRE